MVSSSSCCNEAIPAHRAGASASSISGTSHTTSFCVRGNRLNSQYNQPIKIPIRANSLCTHIEYYNTSACSNLSLVVVLSALSNSGTLSNEEPWFGFRYFVAFQILASSAKKSF